MKYMGSKSRVAKYIVPILQDYINKNNITYYCEPFVGGANIIDKIKCNNKVGYDLNKYLIALLNHVKNGLPLLEQVDKSLYSEVRTAVNNNDTSKYTDWEVGNIGFLASFNGRYFDGGYAKSGYEKTKTGQRYRDYYNEAKQNLLNQAENSLFKDCTFTHGDYRNFSGTNYLIYCDPPYDNTKQYSNATKFDYDEFWEKIREWSKDNIVIVSELEAPDDFKCIWKQEVSRSIKAGDKSKATEKLFIKELN